MATELVIHCVGLDGLTITVSGADHSIPLTTRALRVTTHLGTIEYTIPQLPVTYNLADLHGSLIIFDSSGKPLYRWRQHAAAPLSMAGQREPRSPPTADLGRERSSPLVSVLVSVPPCNRTAETSRITRANRALNEPDDVHDTGPGAEASLNPWLRPSMMPNVHATRRSAEACSNPWLRPSMRPDVYDTRPAAVATITIPMPRPSEMIQRRF